MTERNHVKSIAATAALIGAIVGFMGAILSAELRFVRRDDHYRDLARIEKCLEDHKAESREQKDQIIQGVLALTKEVGELREAMIRHHVMQGDKGNLPH